MKFIYFETITNRAIINTENGDIIAYEKKAQHRRTETNANAFINAFPYTEKDFIIQAGRDVLARNFIDRRKFANFYGTI